MMVCRPSSSRSQSITRSTRARRSSTPSSDTSLFVRRRRRSAFSSSRSATVPAGSWLSSLLAVLLASSLAAAEARGSRASGSVVPLPSVGKANDERTPPPAVLWSRESLLRAEIELRRLANGLPARDVLPVVFTVIALGADGSVALTFPLDEGSWALWLPTAGEEEEGERCRGARGGGDPSSIKKLCYSFPTINTY